LDSNESANNFKIYVMGLTMASIGQGRDGW